MRTGANSKNRAYKDVEDLYARLLFSTNVCPHHACPIVCRLSAEGIPPVTTVSEPESADAHEMWESLLVGQIALGQVKIVTHEGLMIKKEPDPCGSPSSRKWAPSAPLLPQHPVPAPFDTDGEYQNLKLNFPGTGVIAGLSTVDDSILSANEEAQFQYASIGEEGRLGKFRQFLRQQELEGRNSDCSSSDEECSAADLKRKLREAFLKFKKLRATENKDANGTIEEVEGGHEPVPESVWNVDPVNSSIFDCLLACFAFF